MFKAVIFDFDGVITDSEVLHLRAVNEAIKKFGMVMSVKDYYKNYLGYNDMDFFTLLIDQGRLKLGDSPLSDVIKEKGRIFEKLAKSEGKIIEGVRTFVEMLAANNVQMAICSGALLAEIEMILEDAKLRGYFKTIVSAEHVTKGKPYPDGFLLALKRLNKICGESINAQDCVVIEDSHWGIDAAKAAKMHIIGVTNSYEAHEFNGVEMAVARLDEIKIEDLQKLCS